MVVESARASGRSGERWLEFTYRIADDSGVENLDLDAIQAAHEEGFREYLSTGGGWATRWTTAERAYDYGWTRHITDVGDWHGKTLRRVIIDPDYHLGQEMRYRSGNHGCWAVDPRIEEAEYQARRAADKAEAAARDAKRREGQEWIAALSDEALKALSDDEADKRGLSWEDLREERRKRASDLADAERAAEWARCTALVPDGSVLVDDGATIPSRYGMGASRREPDIYYAQYVPSGVEDAERTILRDSRRVIGSLADVAAEVDEGRFRVVSVDDVPPEPVMKRAGYDRLDDVKRVDVEIGKETRRVWVVRERYSYKVLVLDERGHKVRKRAIIDAISDRKAEIYGEM